MTNVQAIKALFERPDAITPEGGRKITMEEMKALSITERAELGALCAVELGETIGK